MTARHFLLRVGFLALMLSCACIHQARCQDLVLDTSFSAGVSDTPPNNYVSAIQPDGKILVGGDYEKVNGIPHIGLVRLNPDGTLDSTFNMGGSGPNDDVSEIVILSDGKILIGGSFTTYNGTTRSRLARLNADGTLDTAFNADGAGVNGSSARVTSIVIQSDGKIVVGGQGIRGYNEIITREILRINPDGSFDSSFISGYAHLCGVEQIAVLPDGKIVIVTDNVDDYNAVRVTNMIRVNSNGALDFIYPDIADSNFIPSIYTVAVQPDGKIVIGGVFQTVGDVSRNNFARFNIDGTLDSTFVPPLPTNSFPNAEYLGVQSDGKILAAGSFYWSDGFQRPIIRLNPNGSLDDTFPLIRADSQGYHVTLQPDGKVILSGFFTQTANGEKHAGILRLNANGSVDSAFNTSFAYRHGEVQAVERQPDGKILVGGKFNTANGVTANNLVRFNADGSVDNTFYAGSGPLPPYYGFYNNPFGIRAIAVQPDGKILVGGSFEGFQGFTNSFLMARLNADGSLDNSFTFTSTLPRTANTTVEDIAVLPDGKILICGVLLPSAGVRKIVYRLNTDGSLDTTFNAPSQTIPTGYRIIVQPDGKIFLGGRYNSGRYWMRLNGDGTQDATFTPPSFVLNTVSDAALQPDGKFVIVGDGYVSRLNTNGTIDTGFNPAAVTIGTVNSVAIQADGKILIGGAFAQFAGTSRKQFARLNPDGSLDSSVTSEFTDLSGTINEILLQPDGKPVIGGYFTNYGGVSRDNLLRLMSEPPSSTTPTPTNTPSNTPTTTATPTETCTPASLYDNGSLITNPGFPSGANSSYLQNFYGDIVYGFSASTSAGTRIADDFMVPSGGWTINNVTFYAYQTGSTTTSTFNVAHVQMWNGPPNMPGSAVVFGDTTTNRFSSTAFSSIYRAYGSGFVPVDRPVMKISANLGLTLPQGTYWIDFQLGGTLTAGPYVPPVTIDGQANKPGSNAMQFSGVWAPLIDIGPAMAVQDVPFTFNETCAIGPTPTITSTPTPSLTATLTPTSTNTSTPTFTPTPVAVVSGTITYGNALGAPTPRFVSNVRVTGTGPSTIFTTTIFPNGNYSLSGFQAGSYTVTPSKTGGVNGSISSFDAGRIAQHVAGINVLVGNQLVVADVSGNGTISSFDAGEVAKYAAGLSGFGLTSSWIFTPANRTYASVTTNISGEDYSALLMGEVSGNWMNTGARAIGRKAVGSDVAEGQNRLRKRAASWPNTSDRARTETVAPEQEPAEPQDILASQTEKQSFSANRAAEPQGRISVEIPELTTAADKEIVVPVNVSGIAGKDVISYEFDLKYDPAVIEPVADGVDVKETASRGLSVVFNAATPGLLRVVVYGAYPIDIDGMLLNLRFAAVGAAGSVSPLVFEQIMFNEGEPRVSVAGGEIKLY
jgi:uncharacterized delta-60 repeat protein